MKLAVMLMEIIIAFASLDTNGDGLIDIVEAGKYSPYVIKQGGTVNTDLLMRQYREEIQKLMPKKEIITPQDLPQTPGWSLKQCEQYVNIQLENLSTSPLRRVEFNCCSIPNRFHSILIDKSAESGWHLYIEPDKGFYNWEECYKYTFTPTRL